MNDTPQPPALTTEQRGELHRAKRIARWIALFVPLSLTALTTVLIVTWLPRMPNPAAIHWSTDAPDGFGAPSTYVWLNVLLGGGLTVMMWLMVAHSSRENLTSPRRSDRDSRKRGPAARGSLVVWSGYQRFLSAFAFGFVWFVISISVGSVWVQLDLADAADARGIGLVLGIGIGALVLMTLAGLALQPKIEIRRGVGVPSEPLPLSETSRAVWFGTVRPTGTVLTAVGAAAAAMAIAMVLLLITPDVHPAARWVMIAAFVLVLVIGGLSLWFRVRIDDRGLEARGFIGWPVFLLPSREVEKVEVAQINPFAEFGGWGMRWAPGRFGLVMRTGEGLITTRHDGRIFALTIDDADTAASVLARAAEKAQAEDSHI